MNRNISNFEEWISRNGKLIHDLWNYIGIIRGALSIYNEDPDFEYIKMVYRAIENSESIIEEMKTLERLLIQIVQI